MWWTRAIWTSEENFTQHDVENMQLKEEKKIKKRKWWWEWEWIIKKKNVVKDATIKESIKKPQKR